MFEAILPERRASAEQAMSRLRAARPHIRASLKMPLYGLLSVIFGIETEYRRRGVSDMWKTRKRAVRVFAAALCMVLLAGCSPEYNWREVAVADGVGMVLFPDKPRSEERSLDFSGHALRFTLTTARVDGVIFAVGHAPWPPAMRLDRALRQGVGKEVMASLYRNLGREVPSELPEFGEPFEVAGAASPGMLLQARVWLDDGGLVEGVVMGRAEGFPDAAARQFLDSVAKGR